jgi:hypothetical protein
MKTTILLLAALAATSLRADQPPFGLEDQLQTFLDTNGVEQISDPGEPELVGAGIAFADANAYLTAVTDDFTISSTLPAAYARIQDWEWVDESISGEFSTGSYASQWFDGGAYAYYDVLAAIAAVPPPAYTPPPDYSNPPVVPPHLPHLNPPHDPGAANVPDSGGTGWLLIVSLTAIVATMSPRVAPHVILGVVGGVLTVAYVIIGLVLTPIILPAMILWHRL